MTKRSRHNPEERNPVLELEAWDEDAAAVAIDWELEHDAGSELVNLAKEPTFARQLLSAMTWEDFVALGKKAEGRYLLFGVPFTPHSWYQYIRSLTDVPMRGKLARELANIHESAGFLPPGPPYRYAALPYRAPHYTVGGDGLIGLRDRPGEVSLAHGGILVLEDLVEFDKGALQYLAFVLRDGDNRIRVGNIRGRIFPAKPKLVIGTQTISGLGLGIGHSVPSFLRSLKRLREYVKILQMQLVYVRG